MNRQYFLIALLLGGMLAACTPSQTPEPTKKSAEKPAEKPAAEAVVAKPQDVEPAVPAPEPVGTVFHVLRGKNYPVEVPPGPVDPEATYLAFQAQIQSAFNEIGRFWQEQSQELKEEFAPPSLPLQPLLDRFAAAMSFQGRPRTWRYWSGFKLDLPNWLTIHEDTIKLRELDALPEAVFMSYAFSEEQYPLNKELMRHDSERTLSGALRKLFETWEEEPLEQRARLALSGLMYIRRGPGEDNPAPKTEDELRSFLLDTDFTRLDDGTRADAAFVLYDAMRIFGPDPEYRRKLEETLPGPEAGSDLKTRAIVAFVTRYLALLDSDVEGAASQIAPIEAVLREASADVVGEGPAFALALWGLTDPLYLDVPQGAKLDGDVLGGLSWMTDPRILVRIDSTLQSGQYRLTVSGESMTASTGEDLKIALMKLQYEHDPLLVQNREMQIQAWRTIEDLRKLRDESGRE